MGEKGLTEKHKGGECMEDLQIIELYFARDEAVIRETGNKYG